MMNETIILFEDEGYRLFLPLVYSRPVFDLRCGIFTLREQVAALLGRQPAAICREHLAVVYGAGRWPLGLLGASAPLTLVNGRALDLKWLPDLLDAPVGTIYVARGEPGVSGGITLLGARISPALMSAVLFDLLERHTASALSGLRRFARVVEIDTQMLTYPWDLIAANGAQIAPRSAAADDHRRLGDGGRSTSRTSGSGRPQPGAGLPTPPGTAGRADCARRARRPDCDRRRAR